jgi:hypothetical protein
MMRQVNDYEGLVRRLADAEREIARAHADIKVLRQQRASRGQLRAIASTAVIAAAAVAASVSWSTATQAQAAARPLTVKAPFTVVDAANKPILSVIASNRRGMYLTRSDGAAIVQLWEEYASLRGPFAVTDNADKPMITVQDSTATSVKDASGAEKPLNINRGLQLFNDKGDAVARMAVKDQDGYVAVRQGGQGPGLGGVQAVLTADKTGTYLALAGVGKKINVKLGSQDEGLEFFSDAGKTRAELNRSHLWLGDEGGEGMVEAGTLPDGRGVVRAGPRMGGPLGPGTLNLPFAIMGHK